jgi:hypothetical protein
VTIPSHCSPRTLSRYAIFKLTVNNRGHFKSTVGKYSPPTTRDRRMGTNRGVGRFRMRWRFSIVFPHIYKNLIYRNKRTLSI